VDDIQGVVIGMAGHPLTRTFTLLNYETVGVVRKFVLLDPLLVNVEILQKVSFSFFSCVLKIN